MLRDWWISLWFLLRDRQVNRRTFIQANANCGAKMLCNHCTILWMSGKGDILLYAQTIHTSSLSTFLVCLWLFSQVHLNGVLLKLWFQMSFSCCSPNVVLNQKNVSFSFFFISATVLSGFLSKDFQYLPFKTALIQFSVWVLSSVS